MGRKYNTQNYIDVCNLVQGSLIIIPGLEKHGSHEVLKIVRDTVGKKYILDVRISGTLPVFRYGFSEVQTFKDGR